MKLYGKSTCTTCRDAKAYLNSLGADVEWRDYGKKPLSEVELKKLVGRRGVVEFVNPRSTPYRNLELDSSKLRKQETFDLLLEEVNLMKRPILVVGNEVVIGFDREAYKRLACGPK